MSDAGTIVDKITTLAQAAVAGLTVSKEAIAVDDLDDELFPYSIILQTAYDTEVIDWRQRIRTWTISGAVFVNGESDTRETVQTHLEAIRDGIEADSTLTGSVDQVNVSVAAADDHPDSTLHAGDFEVVCTKVIPG